MGGRSFRASFTRCERGNIAMLFGLLLIPLVGAIGMAIDYQQANAMRATAQEAADAGVLAAARYKQAHPNADDVTLSAIASKTMRANLAAASKHIMTDASVAFDPVRSKFVITVDGASRTRFLAVVGIPEIPLKVQAEVGVSDPRPLEIVLALDNTGSMNDNGKIDDLKSASRNLVEAVFAASESADSTRVGVVPFAQYVNVGATLAGASWLSAPSATWAGCVGSRTYPWNLADSYYDTLKVPGVDGAPCPAPILPLTNDKPKILSMVEGMTGSGWTYIPSGLAWAWRAISPGAPFAEGASYDAMRDKNGVKAIVLMTDGENTRSPTYPLHDGANQSQANDFTEELCKNVKADGIVLYTVAFDVSDPTIRSILERCATDTSYYFEASDGEALNSALAAIAASVREISLVR